MGRKIFLIYKDPYHEVKKCFFKIEVALRTLPFFVNMKSEPNIYIY